MTVPLPEALTWRLFQQLRRHQFHLGPDDYLALRSALQAGFGWQSAAALCELCCALWAKSPRERDILKAVFDQLELSHWLLPSSPAPPQLRQVLEPLSMTSSASQSLPDPPPVTHGYDTFPPIQVSPGYLSSYSFVFEPQFPISYREIVQACRRLRRPVRIGPATELDIEATIDQRYRSGVLSSIVLRPRRSNLARLVLLVDRKKSMAPFHQFSDAVCAAIQKAARLDQISIYFFQNVPVLGSNDHLLGAIGPYPTLDSILSRIEPQEEGTLFDDPLLLQPTPLRLVLEREASGAYVAVLSDGGAAHGRYNPTRLLDTLAFFKALRRVAMSYVWLNPLPKQAWTNSTAAQLARHIPMFPLNRVGMHDAVNVLRGHMHDLEMPL